MKTALSLSIACFAVFTAPLTQKSPQVSSVQSDVVLHYPSHRDYVVVREGVPYTVPSGHLFIATAVGDAANNASYSLSIDGTVAVCSLFTLGPLAGVGAIAALPSGVVADEGTTVEPTLAAFWPGTSIGSGRAWGVLVRKMANGKTPPICATPLPVTTDRVVIREGESFTVPTNKVLVVTGIGSSASFPNHSLRINGTIEVSGGARELHSTSIVDLPIGLSAPSGALVEVVDMPNANGDFGTGVALGYLARP